MAETSLHYEETEFSDMPVGEILRRTREHYNQSIEDIESTLRIRASQIIAIEEGDLSKLPGKVYAIGFVRSYAEYLGLDGDKMVHLFKVQSSGKTDEPQLQFPAPAADGQAPAVWLVVICIIASILVLVFWLGSGEESRKAVEEIPPVPEEMQVIEDESLSQAELSTPADNEETPIIEEKPQEGIILNILENSWVEIRDKGGKAMLSRVLKAGDQYYVPDRPDLTISIGNAGGVEVEVDGQKLRQLGETGQVLRRLPLDAEYLKTNFTLETQP